MNEKNTSPARINRVQCSIRNLLEFCTSDDDEYEDYEINAMRAIKGLPKEKVREIHFVKNEHVEAMLDKLIEKGKYQLALYLALSYESAGRRNEVAQVQKHDFLEANRTNEVTGKRGKKFKLRYFNKSKEIAKLYFEQRGEDDIDSLWTVGFGDEKKAAEYSTLYGWATSLRKVLKKFLAKKLS
jgi:integrase/recombinase XerD